MEYISQEGLEKLKEELQQLKIAERQSIAERLEKAAALGDLSENAEYQEAKEAQSLNESRIGELEEMLKNIVVIKKPVGTDVVQIGSVVVVERSGKDETYLIVGSEEADPLSGKVSNESPLGKAFLGKKRGESFEVKTPGGSMTYKVREIK
ncbi:MAG: transcription elongation factor GreA [Candidatus Sungbacteria bacterium RIFCSPLOWO2_01_FULL_47_32]|uniref:Transcription elongation factor GreA n=1 Tax=Candidatus Sungbacteria bacterium RIFCSPHIGHO2_01_FULL_47_32 TaxID=1802264 RepID=A0A1G2K3B6_9BACT|nr:MAG: Transcription elongation factor GreA [Parcubacteria group bacterium GW2011_GWA2_47_10]OGZ93906.1 MAG: transcription elongation factor GreA [Candidatus Sungbacteria bacterium RIFCSPHIGHO2_01_FULL_47_32]OGZ99158.1 MAG: transcription elongation factor GreA [Candidatus Sungbacteria bacterium RIFCSPHIGHO2_02_FULL_46_12]OHA06034.1 MAG: transcription elongation factor GreA [Candidatus Sungbacteria bacterium RIFCSPLOWO2_01_FULL_47_32]